MAETEEKKEEKPKGKGKGNGGGRPKKAEGDKLVRRVTFLVKKTYYTTMEADMKKKGKRSMTDYIATAIEEYMNKKS